MFCYSCAAKIETNELFCRSCGAEAANALTIETSPGFFRTLSHFTVGVLSFALLFTAFIIIATEFFRGYGSPQLTIVILLAFAGLLAGITSMLFMRLKYKNRRKKKKSEKTPSELTGEPVLRLPEDRFEYPPASVTEKTTNKLKV